MSIQPADSLNSDLEVCFEVKLYLASLLEKLQQGEVLEFVSSDPNAANELEEWAILRGYEILDISQLSDSRTRFLIRRQ